MKITNAIIEGKGVDRYFSYAEDENGNPLSEQQLEETTLEDVYDYLIR